MTTRLTLFSLSVSLCFAAPDLVAQEVPKPAPELQKFAPLIGNWHGEGTAQMGPGEATRWQSQHSYAWTLGGFFVREDTIVTFDGMPKPLVMRIYLGWDVENRRYVAIGVDNDGSVGFEPIDWADDRTMVVLAKKFHQGQRYLERHTTKVDGDTLTFSIDTMGAVGDAMRGVEGKMRRSDKPAAMVLEASAFTATPAPLLQRLGKSAGRFAVKATMVMTPGAPEMKITGRDVVAPLYDGTIVHVHSTGTAEGSDERYVGELFYGYDAELDRLRAVYVSNMGEIGEMTGSFGDDGELVICSEMRYMGQPSAQRMIMAIGPDGAPTTAVGHILQGTAAPYLYWNATYTRQ